MVEVRIVSFEEIKHHAYLASKERVSVKHTPSTIWFGIFDPKLVGFGGLIFKKDKARIKGDFVLHQYRGKGYGHLLTKYRIDTLKKTGRIKIIEAYSLHPKYYKSLGFKEIKMYSKGVHIMQKSI